MKLGRRSGPGAIALTALGVAAATASAQAGPQTTLPCGCLTDFERLVEKLEANYVALPIAYTGERRQAYERRKADVRARAQTASSAACVLVLRQLTDFFQDGHLFIGEYPQPDSAEKARLRDAAEQTDWTEARVRAYLESAAATLEPIEGIWYSPDYRVGIVRERNSTNRQFVAVLLSDRPGWRIGQVKAQFSRRAEGGYATTFFADDHTARHYMGQLQKDLLLHMPPITWGREFPVSPQTVGLLHPGNPRAPMFRQVAPDVVLVSLPSHSPEHKARLDSLIVQQRVPIESARLLIIDIRGNEGGSANTTYGLRPFYYAEPLKGPFGPAGEAVVLSSADNRRYFAGWGQSAFVNSLLARIDATPGALVTFSTDAAPSIKPFRISAGPAQVAVLMDRHVVSAGETFVLEALRSPKVTLVGENTGGVLDYANVSIVRLACAQRGLALGYPMLAASRELPKGGINNVGIPPELRIPRDVTDPIQWIIDRFGK